MTIVCPLCLISITVVVGLLFCTGVLGDAAGTGIGVFDKFIRY